MNTLNSDESIRVKIESKQKEMEKEKKQESREVQSKKQHQAFQSVETSAMSNESFDSRDEKKQESREVQSESEIPMELHWQGAYATNLNRLLAKWISWKQNREIVSMLSTNFS